MNAQFTSTTSATVLPRRHARVVALIYNAGPGPLRLLLAQDEATETVSSSSYSLIVPAGGWYEVPFNYLGPILGKFDSAGTAQISETIKY